MSEFNYDEDKAVKAAISFIDEVAGIATSPNDLLEIFANTALAMMLKHNMCPFCVIGGIAQTVANAEAQNIEFSSTHDASNKHLH